MRVAASMSFSKIDEYVFAYVKKFAIFCSEASYTILEDFPSYSFHGYPPASSSNRFPNMMDSFSSLATKMFSYLAAESMVNHAIEPD